MIDEDVERRRRALAMLSGIGAAIAGLGAGAFLGAQLSPIAWPILAVGVAVHLLGMVGTRRLLGRTRYAISPLEQVGYWTCWLLIVALAVYAALSLLS